MNPEISLSINPDLDYLNMLNKMCRELGSIWDLADKKIDSFESAVMEACINSIQNSNEVNQEFVNLKFSKLSSSIHVYVSNTGNPIESSYFEEPDFDNHPEKGYGLFLINQLADSFNYTHENGINTVQLTFDI